MLLSRTERGPAKTCLVQMALTAEKTPDRQGTLEFAVVDAESVANEAIRARDNLSIGAWAGLLQGMEKRGEERRAYSGLESRGRQPCRCRFRADDRGVVLVRISAANSTPL